VAKVDWHAKDIGTITEFLSAAECDEYVRLGESMGFEDAPLTTGRGPVMMKDVRNNDRVMIDDVGRAQDLYQRLSSLLASRFKKEWTPVGVNERLRLYRYDPGQKFDWHYDGYFERPTGERSFFTFMVYLNENFEGGTTSFADGYHGASIGGAFRVEPKTGMALLFHHPILHRGDAVIAGRKYVLRTDVMYARCIGNVETRV
jgi:hypothetical protein